jgi:methyl-accepting chemotaxis protein
LTIGKRILLGYGLAMLFMALTGIAGYRGTVQLLDANYWVGHTLQVIDVAKDIRADIYEFESACRGFLNTGDEIYMAPTKDLRTRIAENRKRLQWLTVDNLKQQRRLAIMDPLIDRRLDDLTRVVNLRRERGLAVALALGLQIHARDGTAEVKDLLVAVDNEERLLLARREQTAQRDAQNTNRIIFFGDLVGFALAAIIGIATRSYIKHRLAEFQQLVTFVGDGDLTPKSAREGGDEMGKLALGLNQIVNRLRNMAAQTRSATANLTAATVDILASARQQSAVTQEQMAAYRETNATMQQVSQSGLQISEKAKQVTTSAEAVSLANTTGVDAVQKANQTVEAIHEQAEAVAQNIVALSEKTQMVGDILATVNDIAEQSHLLALNAAIEAAAAGEHGRTFSVVAGEIKNLADQSKAATVQVKTILGDIQKEINTSVMLTEEAVKRVDVGRHQADVAAFAIRNMTANIDQSVQAFQQIVAGTNQQQIGFENVMQAMKDLSRGSEQAVASNRQTENAVANLNDVGAQLRMATDGYRL